MGARLSAKINSLKYEFYKYPIFTFYPENITDLKELT